MAQKKFFNDDLMKIGLLLGGGYILYTATDGFKKLFGGIGGGVATAVTGTGAGISEAAQGIGTGTSTAFTGTGQGISTLAMGAGTGGSTLLTGAGQSGSDILTSIGDIFKQFSALGQANFDIGKAKDAVNLQNWTNMTKQTAAFDQQMNEIQNNQAIAKATVEQKIMSAAQTQSAPAQIQSEAKRLTAGSSYGASVWDWLTSAKSTAYNFVSGLVTPSKTLTAPVPEVNNFADVLAAVDKNAPAIAAVKQDITAQAAKVVSNNTVSAPRTVAPVVNTTIAKSSPSSSVNLSKSGYVNTVAPSGINVVGRTITSSKTLTKKK